MYAHKSKSVRALYEQRRRKVVIQEARDYRLLSRWMMKMHPDTFAEFTAFQTKLQAQNPNRRDLTTAPEFVCFIDEGDGMWLCFLAFFLKVLRDCKVFTLCFLDTATPPLSTRFTLKVPLFVLSSAPTTPTPTVMPTSVKLQTESSAPTPPTPTVMPTSVKLQTDDPFNITDKEIDEMLKVIEQGSALGQTSVLDTLDEDLKNVLNMDVNDFIV
jgi:hypothetical protein